VAWARRRPRGCRCRGAASAPWRCPSLAAPQGSVELPGGTGVPVETADGEHCRAPRCGLLVRTACLQQHCSTRADVRGRRAGRATSTGMRQRCRPLLGTRCRLACWAAATGATDHIYCYTWLLPKHSAARWSHQCCLSLRRWAHWMPSVIAMLAAVTDRPDASRAHPVAGASFRYSVSAGVPLGPARCDGNQTRSVPHTAAERMGVDLANKSLNRPGLPAARPAASSHQRSSL